MILKKVNSCGSICLSFYLFARNLKSRIVAIASIPHKNKDKSWMALPSAFGFTQGIYNKGDRMGIWRIQGYVASGPGGPRCYPAAIGIAEEMKGKDELEKLRKRKWRDGTCLSVSWTYSAVYFIGTESPARRDRPKCSHEKLSIAVMIQRLTNA